MIALQQFASVGIATGTTREPPVQVSYQAAGAGSTGAIGYPTGIAAGHVLVLHQMVGDSGGAPSITTPSGWTLMASTTSGLIRSSTYRKIADGTESGSITLSITGDDLGRAGRMYRMSAGIGHESASSAADAASGTAMDAVDVTSTQDLSLACQCMGASGTSTTIGNITGESGGDYTEAVAEYASGAYILSFQVATLATAGSITGGSATLGASRSNRIRHGFVINP